VGVRVGAAGLPPTLVGSYRWGSGGRLIHGEKCAWEKARTQIGLAPGRVFRLKFVQEFLPP
jgi:hypothetical protein